MLCHLKPPLSTFPYSPISLCTSASPRWRLARALRFLSSRSKRRFSACALAVDKSASGWWYHPFWSWHATSSVWQILVPLEETDKHANARRVSFETGLSPLDTKEKMVGKLNDPLIAVLKLMYGKETSQHMPFWAILWRSECSDCCIACWLKKTWKRYIQGIYQRELLVRIY